MMINFDLLNSYMDHDQQIIRAIFLLTWKIIVMVQNGLINFFPMKNGLTYSFYLIA